MCAARRLGRSGSSAAASIGPLLRCSAALAELEPAALPEDQVAEGVKRFEREAAAVVAALPGARVIDSRPVVRHGDVCGRGCRAGGVMAECG